MESLLNVYNRLLELKVEERDSICKSIVSDMGENVSSLITHLKPDVISKLVVISNLNTQIRQIEMFIQTLENYQKVSE